MNLFQQRENYPVDIILPIKDEFESFDESLESILRFDYPDELITLIIADGSIRDQNIEERLERTINEKKSSINFEYLKNDLGLTPVGLNLAIKKGKSPFVVRLDCHSVYPENYIKLLLKKLDESPYIGNVGCPVVASPKSDTFVNKAICNILSEGVGVGGSSFRLKSRNEKSTDTVPFGCFRRKIFDEIGLFNERLHRNQDIEFNHRIREYGKKIILLPFPLIKYFPEDRIFAFLKKAFLNGFWNGKTCLISSFKVLSLRHFVPGLFVFTILTASILSIFKSFIAFSFLLGIVAVYLIYISTGIFKLKGVFYEKFLTWILLILFHQSYGIGFLSSFVIIKNYTSYK